MKRYSMEQHRHLFAHEDGSCLATSQGEMEEGGQSFNCILYASCPVVEQEDLADNSEYSAKPETERINLT